MRILNTEGIKNWETFTCQIQGIDMYSLMERASTSFVQWIERWQTPCKVLVLVGPGNNGGDALGIARMLAQKYFDVHIWITSAPDKYGPSSATNYSLIKQSANCSLHVLPSQSDYPNLSDYKIIIDGIFGCGLSKPIEGYFLDVVNYINKYKIDGQKIVAIDVPTGLNSDSIMPSVVLLTDYIYTFQVPKPCFFFPENEPYISEWVVGDIGLDEKYVLSCHAQNPYIFDRKKISDFLKTRKRFSHKGQYGHALLAVGAEGTVGAAILAVKACMRSGVGLVTACVPYHMAPVLYQTIPEAMAICSGGKYLEMLRSDGRYNAVGLGPGIGQHTITAEAIIRFIKDYSGSLVLDADALNILSSHPHVLNDLKPNTILTPHLKEFNRLFGHTEDSKDMYAQQVKMSLKYKIIIVLKGAYTRITDANGHIYVNTTGNPGMATAGSGDALTGIITGLLTQQYQPLEAAILGVYLHGKAGDLALSTQSQESLLASDIIDFIGQAYKTLYAV